MAEVGAGIVTLAMLGAIGFVVRWAFRAGRARRTRPPRRWSADEVVTEDAVTIYAVRGDERVALTHVAMHQDDFESELYEARARTEQQIIALNLGQRPG